MLGGDSGACCARGGLCRAYGRGARTPAATSNFIRSQRDWYRSMRTDEVRSQRDWYRSMRTDEARRTGPVSK
jgi:hypothetical protein